MLRMEQTKEGPSNCLTKWHEGPVSPPPLHILPLDREVPASPRGLLPPTDLPLRYITLSFLKAVHAQGTSSHPVALSSTHYALSEGLSFPLPLSNST